ncbi:MAG: primosomal protein N' [Mycoplasmatota bacterium]|nr:primosomal protein N' [Mycoplasmatota bacterium]
MVIGVLVELSNKNIDKVFDYKVPEDLETDIKIGIRVEVPFGKQVLDGFVLEIKENESIGYKLREIIRIKDKEIVLNTELLELGKIIQENTLATLISCYQVMLPKGLKASNGTVVSKRYDIFYRVNDSFAGKLTGKQEEIVSFIRENKIVKKEMLCNFSSNILGTLVKKGVLLIEKREHYRLSYDKELGTKMQLTNDQERVVLEVLQETNFKPYLLHGVTGSGKTEVYMELIEDALNRGKSSIMLVPEISLTPQMVERFQKRFGDNIAALHSALSDGEKYDEWRRIERGEAVIVIGARSAIFAPLDNIGMIIIDEEHSDSYKQSDSNPRYNAKDIALVRAKYHNCPVIFGSATPSLEIMARAQKGVYKYLSLPNRVNGKKLPLVRIIDMNEEIKKSKGHFSRNLITAIADKLKKGEQIILLLNRRGYASIVTCKNCGYTFKCPNCDISLTFHKSSNTMRCHYCGYGTKVYDICPECSEKAISDLGVGTQRIEEELNELFGEARILRMDVDTTSRKGAHEKMINAFKNHEYDILLGTQIVAKGLDFSNVTLVGVINADTSLNIPDFRSSENTFALLSQVAGRSGRSEKSGEVIIQTFNPEHYAISYTKTHDYIGFYNKEMYIRKTLKYPPFYYLCYIKISGKKVDEVGNEAEKIKRALVRNLYNTTVLGPTPATIFRVNNIYRYGIILKYKKEDRLKETLEKILEYYKAKTSIKIDVDFNPSQIY